MKVRFAVQSYKNYYSFKIQTCKNPNILPYTSRKVVEQHLENWIWIQQLRWSRWRGGEPCQPTVKLFCMMHMQRKRWKSGQIPALSHSPSVIKPSQAMGVHEIAMQAIGCCEKFLLYPHFRLTNLTALSNCVGVGWKAYDECKVCNANVCWCNTSVMQRKSPQSL